MILELYWLQISVTLESIFSLVELFWDWPLVYLLQMLVNIFLYRRPNVPCRSNVIFTKTLLARFNTPACVYEPSRCSYLPIRPWLCYSFLIFGTANALNVLTHLGCQNSLCPVLIKFWKHILIKSYFKCSTAKKRILDYFVRGGIIVLLTCCCIDLVSTKQVNLLLIYN